ncbi:RimJ/RimL family protein N-acetyltransferase [Paenibacillus sambharensis]|uniref:RimJ/RimL family protein N-acetyltransferase n=1 Tax=Paenibacillus sambharensis TaxID=1803190 RepID=A0A2W1LNV9_9BACL|nr:GNAT family protein [Paenibacillus sambharensis]PZD96184.1 RimJ/RimL family protein N-acetyltransferase [Paenibacillus sambharensis]
MLSCKINDLLELRLLENRHAEEMFLLVDSNRGRLREWLPWLDNTVSVEQCREFIRMSLKAFAENNGLYLGIFHQGRLAGCVSLNNIDWSNRKTTIGYWLSEDFEGRGTMTAACRTLIDYIFHELLLNRVEIRAAVQNTKSRAIPERLGFVQEGIVRQAEWLYDHYVDHVVYGMLKEEWA